MLFRKSETQIKVKHKGEAERMDTNRSSGFTLIELLVVIAIIGFLAAVVMSSLQSAREKAYDAQIKSDMGQIRNALELYANDNNYTYPPKVTMNSVAPSLADATVNQSIAKFSVSNTIFNTFASLFSKPVYAQSEGGRNSNCTYFDNLSSLLVPNYIGAIPQHPLDDGADVCYQYFISDSGSTAVAYAPLVTEHYGSGASKQIGVALGNTDFDSLSAICNQILTAGENGSTPFPLFSGGGTSCTGTIADAVLGITSGSGDVSHAESCSIGGYDNETDCETDHSSCSDSQYTASGESVCEENGITVADSCQDHPEYTTQSACEDAGYYEGAGCSSGSYPDEESCTTAGATAGSCNGGGGIYTTQSACEDAEYVSTPAHCSGGSYPDAESCEAATYVTVPAYCNAYDPVTEECTNWVPEQTAPYGYTWIPDVSTPYDYVWTEGSPGYGYTWIPDGYTPYGYEWTGGSPGYGYTWNPGTWTLYGYQWTGGSYTPNVWTSSPAGTWGVYGD